MSKKHYCASCGKQTEHEREETLPAEYKSGDPSYEDTSKCGLCGDYYLCDECGAQWDTAKGECSAVLEQGFHAGEEEDEIVRAKGILDGAKTLDDAITQAEEFVTALRQLRQQGYCLAEIPVHDDYMMIRKAT